MAKKYRVAVVGGAGTWGRYYLRTYASLPQCQIVALVDRARDRRQAFADKYGVRQVFDSVEELLAREVPDIVSAIVPVTQNLPVVRACAEARVRVVSCEKPIAVSLAEADETVRVCRERGTLFGCGQAMWGTPYTQQVVDWVHAGHIGALTAAAIPGGLPVEVSGGGCVQLATLRGLTRMDVSWVEGYTHDPVPRYVANPDGPEVEKDRPAWGRLGLSGGIACDIAEPREQRVSTFVAAEGEGGHVWLSSPQPVLVQGKGATASPVFPEFMGKPYEHETLFRGRIESLLRAHDSGQDPPSSGDDFRHSLEVAIALVRSAANGHERVHLPLKDRSLKLYPARYRMQGGDLAGWESIGYKGPPEVL